MGSTKFWIVFHNQVERIDHWALYLDGNTNQHCDIWQASGQAFEFIATHFRGMRPESVFDFKEKWLIKDGVTEAETEIIRDVANNNPVDNEGAYWDCRVFCFEIMGSLENRGVLSRTSKEYRIFRRRLHQKWKMDDGIAANESSASENEGDRMEEVPNLTKVHEPHLEESAADMFPGRGEVKDEMSLFSSQEQGRFSASNKRFEVQSIKKEED